MDPYSNSFDSTSAYLVGSQFSGEQSGESSGNGPEYRLEPPSLELTGHRAAERASAPSRQLQLSTTVVNGDGQYWLGRAHGYISSDPSLGFMPHGHTMAARDAWDFAQILESNSAGASTRDEHGMERHKSPQFRDYFVEPATFIMFPYQNNGNVQQASSSTAASQGSDQSVKMEIPAGPAPPSRRRPRHYCDMDACKGRSKSFSRPADLTRHQDAVHGQSSVRYLCYTKPCNYHCLRRDKMKEHCQKMHDQSRGEEQFSSELYDGSSEENPQWRWWLTHSI